MIVFAAECTVYAVSALRGTAGALIEVITHGVTVTVTLVYCTGPLAGVECVTANVYCLACACWFALIVITLVLAVRAK